MIEETTSLSLAEIKLLLLTVVILKIWFFVLF